MGTYNGGRFIAEQLNSIAEQTHTNWKIVVSDDGSSDETLEVVGDYAGRWPEGRLTVRCGPRQGFCRNFLSLACEPDIYSDLYAFSDQDDIWEPEKIERAVLWLKTIPPTTPALYCSCTKLINAHGHEVGLSTCILQPPSFRNALVQNIGGGNTMVFNEAARQLIVAGGFDVRVPSHDWWTYIMVTGAGGVVHYDHFPSVRYRQHTANVIGENKSAFAKFTRLGQLAKGRFRYWNSLHIAALSQNSHLLTPCNLALLEQLKRTHEGSLCERTRSFAKAKFYRQTLLDHLGMFLAVALKRW